MKTFILLIIMLTGLLNPLKKTNDEFRERVKKQLYENRKIFEIETKIDTSSFRERIKKQLKVSIHAPV